MTLTEIKDKVKKDDFVTIKISACAPNTIACEVVDATGLLIESARYTNDELDKARAHLFVFAERWAAKDTVIIINPFVN